MPALSKIPFPELSFISQYITPDFKGTDYLLPEEKVFVQNSAEKRRIDFSTGRYCARKALSTLIGTQSAILQGNNRKPIWPDGVVGSISHSDKLTGAVVALQGDVKAIGLDIETIGGVEPAMWNMLFHLSEQKLIRRKPGDEAVWATLLFSLKEAFYKMQYPLTGKYVDFLDVCVYEIGDRLCLKVKNVDINLQPIVLDGLMVKWCVVKDQLLTICYISV